MRWIALAALLLVSPAFAQTGSAVLTCGAPTAYTDGTPISGAITYRFYRGTTAGSQTTASPDQPSCAYTWPGLAVGTHYFSATAIVDGEESERSNVASKVIVATPNPPTNLTVQADTTAFVIVKSRDRVALVPVGTVAPGTSCDSTQQILGRFVVPRASVTFASSVQDEVILAACG